MNDLITFEEAKELFYYNAATGLLFSRVVGHQRDIGTILGSDQSNGTLGVSVKGRLCGVHRICWLLETGAWPDHQIKHINGNKKDNSFENLAKLTPYDNINGVNKVAGVGFVNKTKRWKATISVKGNQKFLGEYDTLEEAVCARFAVEQCLELVVNHPKSAREWIRRNL